MRMDSLQRVVGWAWMPFLFLVSNLCGAVFPDGPVAPPGYEKPAKVYLAWDANPEPDIAGYRIYAGLQSRTYSEVIDVPCLITNSSTSITNFTWFTNEVSGDVTVSTNVVTYTKRATYIHNTNGVATNMVRGVPIFFAATAYNVSGLESDLSNEIEFVAPTNSAPIPPVSIRLPFPGVLETSFLMTTNWLSVMTSDDLSFNRWDLFAAVEVYDYDELPVIVKFEWPAPLDPKKFFRSVTP